MNKTVPIAITLLLVLGTFAFAQPSHVLATVEKSPRAPSVVIPEHAVEITPGVFDLGETEVNGKKLQGYAFVDYRREFGKPGTECGNGICEESENKNNCAIDCRSGENPGKGESVCFSVLSKRMGWKTTEPYVLDTANIDGMSDFFVAATIETSLETWDTETGFDVFGTRDLGSVVDGADTESPDGKNEVLFGNIDSPGAIAVTTVWGIFRGPPSEREIVEWDMVFDDTDFDFGDATLNPLVMDLQNIATHEDGHALGLGHPTDDCTEETMYRFADFGETKKRTLESGDLTGLHELYGI